MKPTDTDRYLASLHSRLDRGPPIEHADVDRLLTIIEEQGREILRLRALSCLDPSTVIGEVIHERARQEAKWGRQDHPWHPPGLSAESARHELRIPSSTEAKDYVAALADYGLLSWSAILLEEIAEAVDESDETIARRELVQVAAVAVAAVEAIDRRTPHVTASLPSSPVPPAGAAGSASDLSSAAAGSEGGPRLALKPGDRVRYYPSGRAGLDRKSYEGTVRTHPWLLGGHTWVVNLHEMDGTYKRGECSVVFSASVDALELLSEQEGGRVRPCPDCRPGREVARCPTCGGAGFVGVP